MLLVFVHVTGFWVKGIKMVSVKTKLRKVGAGAILLERTAWNNFSPGMLTPRIFYKS